MYNEQVVTLLIEKYGKESTATYCKMESFRNQLLAKEVKENEMNELEYEANWWEDRYKELLKH
jgi:hypothetical protein